VIDGLWSADGATIKRGRLRRSGITLDVTIARPPKNDLLESFPGSYGICLVTRTGPYDFNIALARRATRMGYRYAPFVGVIETTSGRCLASQEEPEVFAALELPWIPPQDRHANAA
jgi:DNA polymerase/3'-5' exonuclease PolX